MIKQGDTLPAMKLMTATPDGPRDFDVSRAEAVLATL